MTIQPDKTTGTVQIDVQGSYTPDQLLDLIKRLSAARAKLAKDPATPGEIRVAPVASCHVQLMGDAGPESLLAFRFPGLGWIGATMTAPARAQLISLLAAQQAIVANRVADTAPAPATSAESSLSLEPGPEGTTLH